MNLETINSFITYLTSKHHEPAEVFTHLRLVVLQSFDIKGISFLKLNDTNELIPILRSGFTPETILKMPLIFDMNDNFPKIRAIKTMKNIWINTLPEWGEEDKNMNFYSTDFNYKTYIAIPIYVNSTPVGVLTLISGLKHTENDESNALLKTIGNLVSMYFFAGNPLQLRKVEDDKIVFAVETEVRSEPLTIRQFDILRLMSEGQTDLYISEFLGLTETMIRHEIISIFAKLGCSNRSQAVEKFRDI